MFNFVPPEARHMPAKDINARESSEVKNNIGIKVRDYGEGFYFCMTKSLSDKFPRCFS